MTALTGTRAPAGEGAATRVSGPRSTRRCCSLAETGHLQRLWPVAAARAEAAWLEGRFRRAEPGWEEVDTIAHALRYPWAVGELGYWRWRAGVPIEGCRAMRRPRSRCTSAGARRRRPPPGRRWAAPTRQRSRGPTWMTPTRQRATLGRPRRARRSPDGRAGGDRSSGRQAPDCPRRPRFVDTAQPVRAHRSRARGRHAGRRRAAPTPRSPSGCTSRPAPSTITSRACCRSSPSPTGATRPARSHGWGSPAPDAREEARITPPSGVGGAKVGSPSTS